MHYSSVFIQKEYEEYFNSRIIKHPENEDLAHDELKTDIQIENIRENLKNIKNLNKNMNLSKFMSEDLYKYPRFDCNSEI